MNAILFYFFCGILPTLEFASETVRNGDSMFAVGKPVLISVRSLIVRLTQCRRMLNLTVFCS